MYKRIEKSYKDFIKAVLNLDGAIYSEEHYKT